MRRSGIKSICRIDRSFFTGICLGSKHVLHFAPHTRCKAAYPSSIRLRSVNLSCVRRLNVGTSSCRSVLISNSTARPNPSGCKDTRRQIQSPSKSGNEGFRPAGILITARSVGAPGRIEICGKTSPGASKDTLCICRPKYEKYM